MVFWNQCLVNSNCNFIIISTNCGLVAASRHFTSINYDVIFSFDADRKLPTLCQQQNTFTLLLSVTIDASTTLLMSFGLGSFKFLDQNLTSGPELAVIQKEGRFLRPLRSRDNQCWILRLRLRNFVIISESLAANLEKVRQISVLFWSICLFFVPQRLTLP